MKSGKRRFFRLCFEAEGEIGRAGEGEDQRLGSFNYLELNQGKQLVRLPKDVSFIINHPQNIDFDVIVNGLGWITISKRLAETFQQKCGTDIELLPIPILNTSGFALPIEFVVLNALRLLPVLAEDKSTRAPGRFSGRTWSSFESRNQG